MTARLLVIVPSRGRPANVARLRAAIDSTATDPVDMYVRLDSDDPTRGEYAPHPHISYAVGPRVRLASSWNEAAQAAPDEYEHLAFWGDDVVPRTRGWDRALVGELEKRQGAAIVYGRDGIWDHTVGNRIPGQLNLPTHTIIGRVLIRALGWVALPGLVHYEIDRVWRELGAATGTLVFAPDVLIEHLHPIRNWRLEDATYDDALVHREPDRATYRTWRDGPAFAEDCARVEALLRA